MSGRLVPVEELKPGDRLLLPGMVGEVEVQRLDRYPDHAGEVIFVRWRAGGSYPRGHYLAGQPLELGSLKPLRAGDAVKVPA